MVIKSFDASVAGAAVLAMFLDLRITELAKGDVVLVWMKRRRFRCIILEDKREWEKWVHMIRAGVPWIQILPPYEGSEDLLLQPPKESENNLTQNEPIVELHLLGFGPFLLETGFVSWVDGGAPYKQENHRNRQEGKESGECDFGTSVTKEKPQKGIECHHKETVNCHSHHLQRVEGPLPAMASGNNHIVCNLNLGLVSFLRLRNLN